jgi:hypothetical protein
MPLPPLPSFLIQVQNPYMEFGLIIPNIMEGEVLFHLRNPPCWVGSIKFMHVNFGHLIPRVWRTPRGVGGMSMLIMGMLRVLWVGLNILTLEELHGFMMATWIVGRTCLNSLCMVVVGSSIFVVLGGHLVLQGLLGSESGW